MGAARAEWLRRRVFVERRDPKRGGEGEGRDHERRCPSPLTWRRGARYACPACGRVSVTQQRRRRPHRDCSYTRALPPSVAACIVSALFFGAGFRVQMPPSRATAAAATATAKATAQTVQTVIAKPAAGA
jgi:hypothetical protein